MTTAQIVKNGTASAVKARVALVSRQPGSALAAVFAHSGHELVEFTEWQALREAAASAAFDLILHDEEHAAAGMDLGCPTVLLSHLPTQNASAPNGADSGLDTVLALAVALSQTNARCRDLERTVSGIHTGNALVGRSPVMRRLAGTIGRAADCDATILVEGPQGSGKSLVARIVHCKSRRAGRTLVAVEAAATTQDVLAKALDEARGTTLIVEDVDRLPGTAQAALVRHLKERPSAAAGPAPRIIATTSAHLPELVARGAFREDLLYRLHTLPIAVPGLRERVEDIALLAQSIASTSATPAGKPAFTAAALAHLEGMSWPGNVAQLETLVRRALLLAGGGTIDREHLQAPAAASPQAAPGTPARHEPSPSEPVTEDSILPFEEEEQRMLSRALSATKGNVRRAAQLLGIGRATLYRKIQQYQLRLQ